VTDKLPPHVVRAHADALARGHEGYIDPDTSLFVMTADALRARGACCGSGCRHCPYTPEEQRVAGRPVDRKAVR
jgi:hypothetical protein